MHEQHHYKLNITWTGNLGKGTSTYTGYSRSHFVQVEGKPELLCSSDPSFRGDTSRYNPEEFFVASISTCHMLWFLHLAAVEGVEITAYTDAATGVMQTGDNGGGRFTSVDLHPKTVSRNPLSQVQLFELHHKANELCFIANSCNFPINHTPENTMLSLLDCTSGK